MPGSEVKADGAGERKDTGKTRVDLIPPDALYELGKVYEVGARKYSIRNWERGMLWSKIIGPLMRHLFKFMAGHERDPETGMRHSAMIAWNAIALLTYELRDLGEDDRHRVDIPEQAGETKIFRQLRKRKKK